MGLPSRRVDVGGQTGVEVLCGAQLGGPVGLDLLEGVAERLPANGQSASSPGWPSGPPPAGPAAGCQQRPPAGRQAGQALSRFAGAGSSRRHGSLVGGGGRDATGLLDRADAARAASASSSSSRSARSTPAAACSRSASRPVAAVKRVELGLLLGDHLVGGVELAASAASLDDQGVVLLAAPVQLGQLGRGRLSALLGGLGGLLLGGGGRAAAAAARASASAASTRSASTSAQHAPQPGVVGGGLAGSPGGRRLGPRRGA